MKVEIFVPYEGNKRKTFRKFHEIITMWLNATLEQLSYHESCGQFINLSIDELKEKKKRFMESKDSIDLRNTFFSFNTVSRYGNGEVEFLSHGLRIKYEGRRGAWSGYSGQAKSSKCLLMLRDILIDVKNRGQLIVLDYNSVDESRPWWDESKF